MVVCSVGGAKSASEDPTDSDRAMKIAREIADGIEGLKKKYPNRLKEFSSEKHLRRVGENGGFAPGTPNNPELASIGYSHGILGRKPLPKDGGGNKRSMEDVFDAKGGVRIYVHVFKGVNRGNDSRPAEKIGDLRIHLYVSGPAGVEIRAELLKLVRKFKTT